MSQKISSFKFGDMPVSVHLSAAAGSLVLVIALTIAALLLAVLPALDAVVTAMVGLLLHWSGVLVHNYGHFFVAKRIGYPSTGIVLWAILGRITYPHDEVELTPQIHVRRALGGPGFSLMLALLVTPVALLWLIPLGGAARFLGYWLLLDYWVVFTIGALLPPLRFDWLTNDGGTIWNVLRQGYSRRVS
jgi:Zn-dependent protease